MSLSFSRRAKTLGFDIFAAIAGCTKKVRHAFDKTCGAADVASRDNICGPGSAQDQVFVDAAG